jgi:hypothetical protein
VPPVYPRPRSLRSGWSRRVATLTLGLLALAALPSRAAIQEPHSQNHVVVQCAITHCAWLSNVQVEQLNGTVRVTLSNGAESQSAVLRGTSQGALSMGAAAVYPAPPRTWSQVTACHHLTIDCTAK